MSQPVPWRRRLLVALATVGTGLVQYFCVLSASTLEERCFATTLLLATALAIALASRRVWFGVFCSACLYGLIWASSALKFKYLAVPAIAPVRRLQHHGIPQTFARSARRGVRRLQ